MKGYTTNVDLMIEHIKVYNGPGEMWIMLLAHLRARTPTGDIITMETTPHYQYALGNKQPYLDWVIKHHSSHKLPLVNFEHLINDESCYLDKPYDQDFVWCDKDFVIIDGVHRVSRLLSLGIAVAPVVRRLIDE